MKNKIIATLVILGIIGTGIVIPFVGVSAILSGILIGIYNKVGYKNKKSKLFGVTNNNKIQQKIGLNMFTSSFIKDKSKFFKTEMVDLFKDLKTGVTYNTVSQAIVLKGLRTMEKNGLITELEYEEIKDKNLLLNKVDHFFINLGMGNYSNPLKVSKKYNISFRRSAKEVDDDFVDTYLGNKVYIDNSIKDEVVVNEIKKRDNISYDNDLSNEVSEDLGRGR